MKARLKSLAPILFGLALVAVGGAELVSAVLYGRIRGRSGWVAFGDQPLMFLLIAAMTAAGMLVLAAALYAMRREDRAFEESMKRRRPRLDEPGHRSVAPPPDRR